MAQQGIRPTKEELEKLERKHGEVFTLEMGPHQLVLRPPSPPEYDAFLSDLQDDRKRKACFEMLARDVIVFPSIDKVEVIYQRYAGLWARVANAAAEIADGEAVKTSKKWLNSSSAPDESQPTQPAA